MTTPSQQELEQPVKGYQLLAVSNELSQVNKKLDTLITQTRGLVTLDQLKELETDLKCYVDSELAKAVDNHNTDILSIKNKYEPIRKGLDVAGKAATIAAIGTVVGGTIGLAAQIIVFFLKGNL